MQPNILISGLQLETYLKSYNISTDLYIINYRQDYSLNNYIEIVNTNIFYKDTPIVINDVSFKDTATAQDKNLIIEALNELRLKLN